jgi:hypothetical protein
VNGMIILLQVICQLIPDPATGSVFTHSFPIRDTKPEYMLIINN